MQSGMLYSCSRICHEKNQCVEEREEVRGSKVVVGDIKDPPVLALSPGPTAK
jgi:hypothetical protein